MTDIAVPESVPRVDPGNLLGEREMLDAWLEYHRATLLQKCAGLTTEQLSRRAVMPSELSLLGLVRHMTEVERNWFRRVMAAEDAPPLFYSDADPDGDMHIPVGVDAAACVATYEAECAHAREVASRFSLDGTGNRRGVPVSLRWVLVHMIEEYARHNGHADLLRACIDGATGD